jgi:hypothetical protein
MAVLITLLLSAITGIAQPRTAQARNGNAQMREATSCYNPLLLNNRPFNYADFYLSTKGLLTVVAGNSKTNEVEKIPFRIYLHRNGKIINQGASDTTKSLLTINVASVLAIAKAGDYLVIEPTRKGDTKARRVIKLKDYVFNANLFSFLKNQGDGC